MGNEQSQVKPTTTGGDFCSAIRYTVDKTVRYRGIFKEYIYVSKEYAIEIQADHSRPVVPYEEEKWKDVHNDWTTVQIKRSTLELCKQYLELQDKVTNILQIELKRTD